MQFVVDGDWVTDHTAPQEDDGHGNVNNVLVPESIKTHTAEAAGATGGAAAVMSGVTPEATTAGLAGDVPKESEKAPSSSPPGAFPETPATEPESFSAKPIPASSGIGNPVKLEAGEKVPDPSTINDNTVESTATTDKAGYEADASANTIPEKTADKDDSAFSVPEKSENMIPESSLPIGEGKPTDTTDTGPTIQSAAPESTTAALAGAVPKEPRGEAKVVEDEAPSATVTGPAEDVPEVVKESLAEAHQSPEAAGYENVVEEKKEMEEQLLQQVKPEEGTGEPAPTATAATTETAPEPTPATTEAAAEEPKPAAPLPESRDLSPMSKDPNAPVQPLVTTGTGAAKTSTTSTPKKDTTTSDASKEKKKKNRASGFFGKLKGAFK